MVIQNRNKHKRMHFRSHRPTIIDIARLAKVSTTTVSYVLNKAPGVSAIPRETQLRVEEAVKRLGYEPNHLAQSLKTRRSKMIGLTVADIRDPNFGEIIRGVETTLK